MVAISFDTIFWHKTWISIQPPPPSSPLNSAQNWIHLDSSVHRLSTKPQPTWISIQTLTPYQSQSNPSKLTWIHSDSNSRPFVTTQPVNVTKTESSPDFPPYVPWFNWIQSNQTWIPIHTPTLCPSQFNSTESSSRLSSLRIWSNFTNPNKLETPSIILLSTLLNSTHSNSIWIHTAQNKKKVKLFLSKKSRFFYTNFLTEFFDWICLQIEKTLQQ